MSFLKQFILDLRIKGTSDHVHVVTPDYFMEIRSVSNLGIKTGWSSYIYPWVVSIVLKQSHGLSMCVNRLDITLGTILLSVAFWNMMGHELQLLHDYWAHIYTHINIYIYIHTRINIYIYIYIYSLIIYFILYGANMICLNTNKVLVPISHITIYQNDLTTTHYQYSSTYNVILYRTHSIANAGGGDPHQCVESALQAAVEQEQEI